jgi:general stress protein 26
MPHADATQRGLALVKRSDFAMIASIDSDGYPNVRAMLKMDHDGLREIWFTTNTSSRKIEQIEANPRTSVYFAGFEKYEGLQLVGTVEVIDDPKSRERLWRDGFEKYYPGGVTDPDHSVLRFTAKHGEYYHNLSVTTFSL